MMDLAKGKYDTSSQAHCGTFYLSNHYFKDELVLPWLDKII